MADAVLYPPSIPQDGVLHPALEDATNIFQSDEGRDWSKGIAADVQQHLNILNTADANEAVGNQYMRNFAGVKEDLVGMAHDDPSSAQLAIDLTPKMVGPMLGTSGLTGDDLENTHNAITSHIQSEIAHTAVMRMADFSTHGAMQLLGTLDPHIDDNARATLTDYIAGLHMARGFDQAAANVAGSDAAMRNSNIAAYRYGSTLLDPRSENIQFPQGFAANLMRNQDISPDDKLPLMQVYNTLLTRGDRNQSNPYAVLKTLSDIVNPGIPVTHGDILSHVGDDMRFVDALMLHGFNLQRTPDMQSNVRQLRDTLGNAQMALASNGDRAGNVAFSRFANWLLPAVRRTGMSGLNPGSDNYLLRDMSPAAFAPSHEDAVAPFNLGSRKPLAEIFAPRLNNG